MHLLTFQNDIKYSTELSLLDQLQGKLCSNTTGVYYGLSCVLQTTFNGGMPKCRCHNEAF